jgi:predicted DNA binding protein
MQFCAFSPLSEFLAFLCHFVKWGLVDCEVGLANVRESLKSAVGISENPSRPASFVACRLGNQLIPSKAFSLCGFMPDQWSKPYHVVLEVENRQCTIAKRLAPYGLKHVKVADIRSSNPTSVKHLIELDPAELRQIKNPPPELKAALQGKTEDKASLWMESEGCGVCHTILSCDAFLVSGKSLTGYTIMYSFMVPSFEAFQKIVAAMESMGLAVKVLKMGKFEPKAGVLTEKQERIFWLALKGGFFDYPRRIDTAELAKRLGISPSTLSEITRRGMRRLLENYFKSET